MVTTALDPWPKPAVQPRAAEIDEKIDLVALFTLLRDYKWTVLITAVLFGALATTYALLATPIFRAEVTVTVVHDKDQGGAGGLAGSIGDIASLAGVNLTDQSDEMADKAVLASRHLIEVFIERYGVLKALQGKEKAPLTLWKGVNRFHDNVLYIHDDQRKGVTVVGISWTNPLVAARWANDFLALANELIRTKALNDAKRNVDFLTAQTSRTNSIEVQRALYGLVMSETKKLMLANERTEYAFSVADPAVAPELRSSPKRTLIVMVGTFIGLFVGAIIAFVRGRLAAHRLHRASA
jgi:uncharacterized protein involved in exopolysaccharide biosynthesis